MSRETALRFTLSQEGVAAGFPPAFVDIFEKAVAAGRAFQPITEGEIKELRELAATRLSVFRREEEQVARRLPSHLPVYPESPHEDSTAAYV